MIGQIEVSPHTIDTVKVGGEIFYSETYIREMMKREYDRGKREGQQIHVAEVVIITQKES